MTSLTELIVKSRKCHLHGVKMVVWVLVRGSEQIERSQKHQENENIVKAGHISLRALCGLLGMQQYQKVMK